MKLPVSVIIPSPDGFIWEPVMDAVARNNPKEICIVDGPNANINRNKGVNRTSQPYLFFCDDDVIMAPQCLLTMVRILQTRDEISYVYCNFTCINHPIHGNYSHHAKPFNADKLKKENYISMMSLIRRKHFPGFDKKIKRLQDWDLWLTMLERNRIGTYIDTSLFATIYGDDGITKQDGYKEAAEIIRRKHKL
jgi:glycosyltransferase involved in cell wall biosynthesis